MQNRAEPVSGHFELQRQLPYRLRLTDIEKKKKKTLPRQPLTLFPKSAGGETIQSWIALPIKLSTTAQGRISLAEVHKHTRIKKDTSGKQGPQFAGRTR